MAETVEVAGVEISRPDKELFPDDGVTKRDLAEYYAAVAEVMLPHLAGRVVNMQRFPDGVGGQGFYEKKVPGHFPDWVRTQQVRTADGRQRQVVVDDARTLVYLADQACVTPHMWLSRVGDLDSPDQLVFDLDPSTDDLGSVQRATVVTGDTLRELGLESFVKTTGSRGYHVHVPLRADEDFEAVRAFGRAVAGLLAERDPDLFTDEQRKDKRGDRVYVDVMRNAYGQTVVPPYAVRAHPGAPVSTPLDWREVTEAPPERYTITSVRRRLAQRDEPWKDFRRHARGLDAARQKLS